jgi:zona occludens toxin (predicted ATPase)
VGQEVWELNPGAASPHQATVESATTASVAAAEVAGALAQEAVAPAVVATVGRQETAQREQPTLVVAAEAEDRVLPRLAGWAARASAE